MSEEQVRQCTINVILRRNRGTIFAVEKAIRLYILSVFVYLVIQHAKPMRCIMLSSVTCLTLPYFLPLSQKRHDFQKERCLFNIKYMFSFSLKLLSENCPILRIIQRDTVINVYVGIPFSGNRVPCGRPDGRTVAHT